MFSQKNVKLDLFGNLATHYLEILTMYERLRRLSTLFRADMHFWYLIMKIYIYKIPNSGIQFIINDHLFFEMLLMGIHGKTTAYASNWKKESRRVEEELSLNTKVLEENLNETNKGEYKNKRDELRRLREKMLEGMIIR